MKQWLTRRKRPAFNRSSLRDNQQGDQDSSVSGVLIMGILNATPDSFSGDGSLDPGLLVEKGLRMIDEGADILDIGGESSQPYATTVDEEEELRRVLPVIRQLRAQTDVPLSIDTRHVSTAAAALDAGVDIVNDISGLSQPDMRKLVCRSGAGAVIMHMQGTPETMQASPRYTDVIDEVGSFLKKQVALAVDAGIEPDCLAVDPGICFGKTLEHNLALIRNLEKIRVENCPVVLGVSRKSMLGSLLNTPASERLEGSLAAAAVGVLHGADIIRVHDVLETYRFLTVLLRLSGEISS